MVILRSFNCIYRNV